MDTLHGLYTTLFSLQFAMIYKFKTLREIKMQNKKIIKFYYGEKLLVIVS